MYRELFLSIEFILMSRIYGFCLLYLLLDSMRNIACYIILYLFICFAYVRKMIGDLRVRLQL